MPSIKPPSPSSSRSSSSPRTHSPTEVTTLLPASSSHTPSLTFVRNHNRKASVSGRSVNGRNVAGSVRGYGAVTRPGPVEQAPRVSRAGQRRILTTLPLQVAFFVLVVLTFTSLALTLILFLNTAMDLSGISPPYRGSGFAEFWISAVASWTGIEGVVFFSHPSYLFFLTTLLTLLLHLPLTLLVLLSSHLRQTHTPLIVIPLSITTSTLCFTLLSNYLVRRARWKEGQRITRMLTDAAARERGNREDDISRALVGVQEKGVWGGFVGFLSGLAGLLAGMAGLLLVTLLLVDMSIAAYDGSVALPSPSSKLVTVQPDSVPWPITVHLACVDPPNLTHIAGSQPYTPPLEAAPHDLPTTLYESASGVPGSLALLDIPLIPSSEDAVNPGRWLFDLQTEGKVGRVCTWDRPGYGFSQVLGNADLGKVADALWLALESAGETEGREFVLVGEGYGGLVTRVFASRHPNQVHSLLHLEAQTAQTYFSESPNNRSSTALLLHRIATRLLPSLLTPLSFTRLPSSVLRRSSSVSRVLASVHPGPSTERLNENLQKARLQEIFGSHSHTSESFRTLLASGRTYPATKPAIVVSSQARMEREEGWEEGQRGLAEEVTGKEALIAWEKVEDVGHFVCEGQGLAVCRGAVQKLLAL